MLDISKSVMRRVYFIWAMRQVFNPLTFKLFAMLLLLWQIKEAVFVRQVFANISSYETAELFNFLSAAFLNTGLVVQVATLGIAMIAVLLVRDFVIAREQKVVFAR